MPRAIQISVPHQRTQELLSELEQVEGVVGLQVQRNSSVQPPGDVITIYSTNRSLHSLMRLLTRHGLGREPGAPITTSEPISIISPDHNAMLVRDTSDATWEELEFLIAKESNMTANALLIMGLAGILAVMGLASNSLHIVIGAMIIAPGFEPLSRIALGAVSRSAAWQRGIADTLKGYGALLVGAVIGTVVLRLLGKSSIPGDSSYLPAGVLFSYWSTLTASSMIITAAASVAGAVLIVTNRAVLTGGVMIALALVPSAAITGTALTLGHLALAGRGALRWSVEASLVVLTSLAVFAWKRKRVQKRDMLL